MKKKNDKEYSDRLSVHNIQYESWRNGMHSIKIQEC